MGSDDSWSVSGLFRDLGRLAEMRLAEVRSGFGGQREVEGGALAWSAGGPDAASVLRDDAATDGQAQAGAAERA